MIYELRSNLVVSPDAGAPNSGTPFDLASRSGMNPAPGQFPASLKQSSYSQSGRFALGNNYADPADVEDFVINGFRALDQSMKMYWSGMRVPTRDSYRFCRVKIAGGDKSLMVWRDELMNGRVQLPVASLNRGKIAFNKDRFNPPYMSMDVRYPSKRGDRALLVYKPQPWLVDYNMTVFAEFKNDADPIMAQIKNRFNPLAGFDMDDGHIRGRVTLRYGDSSDTSDKESAFDQHRMIKYEFAMTAEAWLPLPERLVPTVLGIVMSVKSFDGEELLKALGSGINL